MENEDIRLCDYGCGKIAKYKFKNGKVCCSKNFDSCPETRRKNRERNLGHDCSKETRKLMSEQKCREKNPMYGKHHIEDSLILIKERTFENTPKGETHRLYNKTWEEFYGEEKAKELKEAESQRMLGFVVTKEMKQKRRNTFEERGTWTKLEDMDLHFLYCREVYHYTNLSIKKRFTEEELGTRGRWNNHVDHIFSIQEGFNLGILPCIIGCKGNLRLLNYVDNVRKYNKCDITLKELFKRYYEESKEG